MFWPSGFSSAVALGSICSARRCRLLFAGFTATMANRGRELAYASPPAQIPACALTHGAPASDDDEGQLARLRGGEAPSCYPRNSDSESAPKVCPSLPGWQCRVVVSADRGDLQTRRHERRVSLQPGTPTVLLMPGRMNSSMSAKRRSRKASSCEYKYWSPHRSAGISSRDM